MHDIETGFYAYGLYACVSEVWQTTKSSWTRERR